MVACSSHRSISFNLPVIHSSFVLTFVTKFGSGRSMLRNFGEYGQHQVYESIVQRRVGCHPALWLQIERNRETHYRNITPMSRQVSKTWCRTLWYESNDSSDGTTYTSQLWNPVELQLRTGWHATRVSRFPVHSFFSFFKSKNSTEHVKLKKDYGRGSAFRRDQRVRSYT